MNFKKAGVKKIVIPIDFSETALLAIEHAAFMAKLYQADLLLVHIVEHNWQSFSIVAPEIKFELPGNIFSLIETKLQDIAERIRADYGVNASTLSTEGVVCEEIVELARTEKADLIVMGTHGVSGFAEVFMGSNSFRVVTLSPCPILTVQTHSRRVGFSEILLPIDNSRHSRQKVKYTAELAKQYGARINILGLLEEDDRGDLDKFEKKVEQVRIFIESCGIQVTVHKRIGGNLARNTLEFAKLNNADLIVIMTDQEENFTGSFLGPYAQQIVNHSWIPVLSFKPIEVDENISWAQPYN